MTARGAYYKRDSIRCPEPRCDGVTFSNIALSALAHAIAVAASTLYLKCDKCGAEFAVKGSPES